MWWLFVHAAICVSFLASALATWFPKNLPALVRASSVGHLLLGLCLLLTPSYFLGITVQGNFNSLHAFLQSYCAPFHLALAYFLLSPAGFPQEKPFVFGQAFCALLSLLTRLLTAWHLTEKTTRGLLISDQFILCAFLTEGAWLVCESVKLFTYQKTNQDEIDQMCKRTTLWLEGKGSFYFENVFYIDAALSLLMSFTHFAFPQHILKIVAQVMVFLLNVFGHWYLGIFSPNHISGFMISGFYMSFLFSAFYRATSQYKNLPHITIRQKTKAT
ncbi:hypothetical protein OSTOST_02048 [Ostertagia ostertagi]